MATVKVKRSDGYHCFHCNARVDENAEQCPGCGRRLAEPDAASKGKTRRLGEKVRLATRSRTRSYRLAIIVLLVAVVVLVVLFRPRKSVKPVLPRPAAAMPEYQVIETWNLPARNLDRMSVVGLVSPGMEQESLRAVLDWMLYSMLDEHNRQGERCLRVIWAYVLDDSIARKSGWEAMAIWVDPKLPRSQRPARTGGDALSEGPIEYDFTNTIVLPE